MSKAQDARYEGIQLTVNRYLDDKGEWRGTPDRVDIAADILNLVQLGRTDRWKASINRWADMVCDEKNEIRWAFLQGSIFASHAA